ncbi:MAG TPA: hypothetical protein VGC41_00975, partial [Kofleriaceae bacterium]
MDDYKAKTGQDLRADLTSKLDGANKDVSDKLLDGDVAAANAARVKAATESFFTDKDAIYKAMDGKSPADRAAMMADFKKMYGDKGGGDLDKTLKDNLSGLDLDKANQLKDNGKLDDAFAMKYAMEGSFWSTDKTLLKKTLEGKSKEDVAKLSGEYKAKYGIDLQGELSQTTSGRDGFEINELMKGEPKTIDEKMDRARERYQFERGSGSNPLSKGIVDTFSDKGEMLDAQNARMEDLYKKIHSGQASSEEKALLDRVTGYQGMDTKNYQETKDSVSNGAAAVAAIAASTAATVATGGAAAPAEVAIIAALCGGAATIATKTIIQDQGYSNEELRNDVIMTGVNMATGGTMGALGAEGGALFNAAGKMADSPIAQQMIIQGVSGAVSSGVSGATGAMLQGGDAKAMLKAGGMGALGGGVTGAVTGGVGAGLKGNKAFEGMDPVTAAMLRNGIAGGAGGAAGLAVTPDAYNGDSAALIQKWGLAVGGGAAGGIAGGYNEGTMEVANANKLAIQEQAAQQAHETQPTTGEKSTLEGARELANNPAEVKQIDQVEADLAAGKAAKLNVEEAVPSSTSAAPEEAKVVAPEPAKVVAPEEAKVVAPEPAKVGSPEEAKVVAPEPAKVAEETKVATPAGEVSVVPDVDTVNVKASEAAAVEEPKPAAKSDQGDRDAIMELSRKAKTPEERAQIAKWAEEIDAANPKPMEDSLRQLNIEARADGRLDPIEGSALKEWGHEANLDRMPMLDALEINGMDKAALQGVFEKAALNDASASYKPGDKGVHTASDGTPLAVPGSGDANALTPAEMDMLLDAHGRRNDQLHPAYTTSNGRELEGTPMRKIVNDQQAAEFAQGSRVDRDGNVVPTNKIGGDLGAAANTNGQDAARVAATLGLDYPHSSNQFFDPATNTWVDSIHNQGISGIEMPMTPAMKEASAVPFGQDVHEAAMARGRALAENGEYVPELFQSQAGPNGEEQFPHLTMRNKENENDPRTGFGFSATERAIDPKTGAPYPVSPNQEHNSSTWTDMPEYDVKTIPAAAPEQAPKAMGDSQRNRTPLTPEELAQAKA